MNLFHFSKITAALALCSLSGPSLCSADPWSFGVISDTQWSEASDDGKNPNTVAADIIRQVDKEFIARGVKLVVAVGDTVDVVNKASTDTRALYAQDLYNAGIAFYPLRGNHDAAKADTGVEFARAFPQIGTGVNNRTPADVVTTDLIPAADLAANPPEPKKGEAFSLGKNFSVPETNALHKSISYSFDYQNVRFVLIDQFDNTGHTKNSTLASQLGWIDARLSDPKRPQHAMVFGHKNLLGDGHKDNLFGDHTGSDPGDADPAQQPTQNAFLASLAQNHVHYYICGHDHHHKESLITSPDGHSSVTQVICASDSNKFYAPMPPFSANEKQTLLDLNKIGYYIFTVDGSRVTMDYYGVDVSEALGKSTHFNTTPPLAGNWKKIATSSYDLEATGKKLSQ